MTHFGDRLNRLRVAVEGPGGLISGVLRDRGDVVISFRDNSYYRMTDGELEDRLLTLARLLWVAWIRGFYAELSAATGRNQTTEMPPANDRDRAFREVRDRIESQGSAADGRIRVTCTGVHSLTVRIAPGTAASLTEEQFVDAARSATRWMVEDHMRKINVAKGQIFAPQPASAPPLHGEDR